MIDGNQKKLSNGKAVRKYRRVMPSRTVYIGKHPELSEPDDREVDVQINRPIFESILDEMWDWESAIDELKRGNGFPFFRLIFKNGRERPKEADDLLITMAQSSALFKAKGRKNPRILSAQIELNKLRKHSEKHRYELIREVANRHHVSEGSISNNESLYRRQLFNAETQWHVAIDAATKKQ